MFSTNEKSCYILGLWVADRCSTAKGVFGIRNKNPELLNATRDFLKELDMNVKERSVQGFSLTQEVYCCNSELRRIFEGLKKDRLEILVMNPMFAFAYFAGLIDGDGSVYGSKSSLRIYFGKNELCEAQTDSKILSKFGFGTTIKQNPKIVTMYILKPRKIAPNLLPFVKSSHKLNELKKMAVL